MFSICNAPSAVNPVMSCIVLGRVDKSLLRGTMHSIDHSPLQRSGSREMEAWVREGGADDSRAQPRLPEVSVFLKMREIKDGKGEHVCLS